MASSVEHLFMCLFSICISSSVKYLFMYFAHFLTDCVFLLLSFCFCFLLYFTLQYCIGFAIHQHESTTGVHVLPILNPRPPPPSPYHLSGSSQCTSPKHPVSCIKPRLAIPFLHDIIHVSMSCKSSLCVLSTNVWFINTFYPSMACTFILLTGSFAEQKFTVVIKSNYPLFLLWVVF